MTYSLALVLSSIDSPIPTICVVQNFGNERWLVPSLFKFTITSQGLKLKIVFGCIRGCSATQSQAEKGRDSIPPIEDEHQQFRPVFSCNPILSAVKQNLWYGVMHLQLPNTHLGFVPMRLLFFKHPYLANESKFPFWNGGPVLRWRGPFFFLPTNPLNNGIISLFSGDYLIVIVGRNWQLLPTTLASRSPRFVGYEI